MTQRTRPSWLVYALGALCAGAIAAAILVVGPASGSQTAATRTATVAEGVVQSTVSGAGNLAPASQLNLGFNTSGTITRILVSQGQRVTSGQLLAELDPQNVEVTLEQAKATLQSAEANLAKEEETNGEGSTGSNSGASTGAGGAAGSSATSTASVGRASTVTASVPASSTKSTTGSAHTPTISAATREADLASARAAVKSDRLTVQSDQQAVQNTKLYAPESGTIASLAGQVGENVSASGTTKASSSASSSGSSGSGAGAAGGGVGGSKATAAASNGGSSTASSSAFAVLSNLSSMQLVVPLSESEIGNVKVGQIATVTIEALSGRKVAAHVAEVAILATSNSGVVSYDVTFQLDPLQEGLKPGMSASAEVVVKQAEGVNVPTSPSTSAWS